MLTDARFKCVGEVETVLVSLPSGHQGVFRSFIFLPSRHRMFDHSPSRLLTRPLPTSFFQSSSLDNQPASFDRGCKSSHLGRRPSSVPRPGCCNQTPLPSSHICNPDSSADCRLQAERGETCASQTEGGQKGAPLETLEQIF